MMTKTWQGGLTRPRKLSVWLFLIGFVFVQPIEIMIFPSSAYAQEVRKKRSIFDIIFGNNRNRETRQRPPVTRVERKKKPKTATAAVAVKPEEQAVEKLPDAKKVMIVGDFMAAALADGLSMAFAQDPSLVIVKEADGSSGLVRQDHLNWPVTLKAKLQEVKPSVVVVMLGANDRQQIAAGGEKLKFPSEQWSKEYEKRISDFIEVTAQTRTPLIWAGLPSFQSPSLSADAATFNSLYRSHTEAGGGVFIDIWDGFADENGKFIASGSDVNGQPVRLRGSDGLSFTKAGKRKMAFYLEKDLRRLAGINLEPSKDLFSLSSLKTGNEPNPALLKDIVNVPPISLADPELDGSGNLLDMTLLPKGSAKSPRDLLIEKGETGNAPAGRVDDFAWKASKAR